MEVICIVMGSASTIADNGYAVEIYGGYPETISLLNHAFYNQSRVQFLCKDQILKQQSVVNGDSDVYYTTNDTFSAVLPSDITQEQLSYRYQEVPGSGEAPISKGQNLASLEVWYHDICIAKTEVYAANDVAVAVNKTGAYNKTTSAALVVVIVIVVILAIIVCGVLVLLMLRRNNMKKAKHKNQRRG